MKGRKKEEKKKKEVEKEHDPFHFKWKKSISQLSYFLHLTI